MGDGGGGRGGVREGGDGGQGTAVEVQEMVLEEGEGEEQGSPGVKSDDTETAWRALPCPGAETSPSKLLLVMLPKPRSDKKTAPPPRWAEFHAKYELVNRKERWEADMLEVPTPAQMAPPFMPLFAVKDEAVTVRLVPSASIAPPRTPAWPQLSNEEFWMTRLPAATANIEPPDPWGATLLLRKREPLMRVDPDPVVLARSISPPWTVA